MPQAGKHNTILVVDSDKEAQTRIAAILGRQYSLVEAASEKELLERLDTMAIDLVIIARDLPDTTGIEACKKVLGRRDSYQLPLLIVTRQKDEHFVDEAFSAGVTTLLTKPYGAFEVLAAVRTAFNVRAAKKQMGRSVSELKILAEKDPLTNLYNRRVFKHYAAKEISRAYQFGKSLSLLMIDIDFFKETNDEYGHPIGDEVLVEFSQRLMKNLRRYDLITRYGGEEFVVLLPHTSLKQAYNVAEKLRECIANTPFITKKGKISITASIGVISATDKGWDLGHLIRVVDEALFKAKRGGRNQVRLAEEEDQ
ncbi:diguanylate cyclase [Simkania negevensis]|uniref:diguanylate cyclase n=1 Tax=Simkania negevensis TaxID=83561 RepID=A0ABS3APU8_9BACT|nr:diguanylate cyclase [Simkania negevensis]